MRKVVGRAHLQSKGALGDINRADNPDADENYDDDARGTTTLLLRSMCAEHHRFRWRTSA